MPALKRSWTTVGSSRDPSTGRMGPPRRRGPGSGRARRAWPKAKNRIVNVPRNKLAFPSNIRTTLRYSERQPFLLSSLTPSVTEFAVNNLRDPNYTGVGHQPRGFDEYMDLYGSYTVHGATISYHCTYTYSNSAPTFQGTAPQGPSNSHTATAGEIPACPAVVIGIHKGTSVLAGTTVQDFTEQDKVRWTILNGQSSSKIVSTKINVADFWGTSGSLTGKEGYFGGIIAAEDPANIVYAGVFAGQLGELPLPTDYKCNLEGIVTIEFDVTFSEPKSLGAS